MAENKMKEVAKLLGVEMGVPFKIKGFASDYTIKKYDGLCDENNYRCNERLRKLLTGEYEIEQPILNEVEKRYLEGVLRPFKDRVEYIQKRGRFIAEKGDKEYLLIVISSNIGYSNNEYLSMPFFDKGTMYKGMETTKEYTLKELGLFEDEI